MPLSADDGSFQNGSINKVVRVVRVLIRSVWKLDGFDTDLQPLHLKNKTGHNLRQIRKSGSEVAGHPAASMLICHCPFLRQARQACSYRPIHRQFDDNEH